MKRLERSASLQKARTVEQYVSCYCPWACNADCGCVAGNLKITAYQPMLDRVRVAAINQSYSAGYTK